MKSSALVRVSRRAAVEPTTQRVNTASSRTGPPAVSTPTSGRQQQSDTERKYCRLRRKKGSGDICSFTTDKRVRVAAPCNNLPKGKFECIRSSFRHGKMPLTKAHSQKLQYIWDK